MFRYFLLVALLASGCTPSLSPPYRDYRVSERTPEALQDELRAALTEAGWEEGESDAPHVISTLPKQVDSGMLSSMDASLDLAPLNGRYVRVYVHAVRRNFLGSRSKQAYLSPNLRQKALGPITEALSARGLIALDAARERDEEATD